MEIFNKYRRSQVAELADWYPGFDMERVSVSVADKEAGSPKLGDKIARNPVNHADQWLVAADYFAANFEPVTVSEKGEQDADKLLRTVELVLEGYTLHPDARKRLEAARATHPSRKEGE